MKKRLLSLVLTVALVMGIVPVMSAVTVSAAGGTTYFYDDFENYDLKTFSGDGSAATNIVDKFGNTRWSAGSMLKAEIISTKGYDEKTTQVLDLTINAATSTSGSAYRFHMQNLPTASITGTYVYEFKVYNPDDGNNHKNWKILPFRCDAASTYGIGAPANKVGDYENGEWVSVRVVVKSDGNTVVYLNDKLASYNQYTLSYDTPFQYTYFDLSSTKTQDLHIYIDDVNLYYHPATTTVSTSLPENNATEISRTVNPTVTFTEQLLPLTTNTAAAATLTKVEDDSTVEIKSMTLSADGKTLTVTPDYTNSSLDYEEEYTLSITGLKDMYDVAMDDVNITFTVEEQPYIETTEPVFNKINLFNTSDVFAPSEPTVASALTEAGAYTCTYSITNNHETETKNALMFVVLWENGAIKNFQYKAVTLATGETATFNGGFTVSDPENSKIETYIWNDFGTCTPLAKKYVFDSNGIAATEN